MTLPAYLDTHTAIVGSSGAGKTVTAKHQVELLLGDGRHVAILDPTGAWHGLQTNATNTGPGFDIPIFGGLHANVPIGPDDGAAVASVILDVHVSAIVDLSEFHDAEVQRGFAASFVARMRSKPQANFHLVVDEADEFCPQTAPDSDGYRLIQDMIWLAKRGRLRGFVLTMITQRPADIQKAVLSQMQTIFAHQLIAPSDQAAIDAYLKANGDKATRAAVMESLPGLARGERWIYSPRLKLLERGVTPPIATFDSSATPVPGEQRAQARALSDIDAGAIRAALAQARPDTPAANDDAADTGAAATQVAERDAEIARLRAEVETLRSLGDALYRRGIAIGLHRARVAVGAIRIDDAETAGLDPEVIAAVAPPAAASKPVALPCRSTPPAPGEPPALTASARKLLMALTSVSPRSLTLAQAAKLAGVSTVSSAWRANAASLRASRYVAAAGGDLWALSQAATEDPDIAAILSRQPADPLDRWTQSFSPKIGNMLRAIATADEPLSEFEVASTAGVSATSSLLGTGLRELRANGLIEKTANGWVPTATISGGLQ